MKSRRPTADRCFGVSGFFMAILLESSAAPSTLKMADASLPRKSSPPCRWDLAFLFGASDPKWCSEPEGSVGPLLAARRQRCALRGRIILREPVSLVLHGEAAIGSHGHLESVPMIHLVKIRDEVLWRIVLFVHQFRIVLLPEVLESGRAVDDPPGVRRATLLGSVVHHGDPCAGTVHQGRRTRPVCAVARRMIYVERAEQVIRTDQFFFLIPGKVGQVEKPESPVPHYDTYGLVILRVWVLALFRALAAGRIRRPCTRSSCHWTREELACRGHNFDVEARDRNLVAGFWHRGASPLAHRQIGVKSGGAIRLQLHRKRPVIEEVPNRQPIRQLGCIAHVVAVVMRHDYVIKLLDAGLFDGGHDAVNLLTRTVLSAGIHQQRLSGRRSKKRGLAALSV